MLARQARLPLTAVNRRGGAVRGGAVRQHGALHQRAGAISDCNATAAAAKPIGAVTVTLDP